MDNPNSWIEHLQHPLVLIGFVVFVFTGLLKLIKTDKLSGKASAALLTKGVNYVFVLSLVIVLAGFSLSFYKADLQAKASQPKAQTDAANTSQTTLSTEGDKSPAIETGQDVNINYGGVLSDKSKQTDNPNQASKPQPEGNTTITTKGEKSPAIRSGSDVNINYGD